MPIQQQGPARTRYPVLVCDVHNGQFSCAAPVMGMLSSRLYLDVHSDVSEGSEGGYWPAQNAKVQLDQAAALELRDFLVNLYPLEKYPLTASLLDTNNPDNDAKQTSES